jgi:hypothetical protein
MTVSLEATRLTYSVEAPGAEQAAQNLERLAVSFERSDERAKRAGPTFQSVERRLDATATATAKLDGIERRYQGTIAAITAERERGRVTAEREAELLRQAAAARDLDIKRITSWAQSKQAAMERASRAIDQNAASMTAHQRAAQLMTPAVNDNVVALDAASDSAKGFSVSSTELRVANQLLNATMRGDLVGAVRQANDAFRLAGGGATLMRLAINPLTLAIGALGAGLVTLVSRARDSSSELETFEKLLAGTGKTAQTTATDLQAATRALEGFGVARSEARGVVMDLTRDPDINAAAASRIVRTGAGVAGALQLPASEGVGRVLSVIRSWDIERVLDMARAVNALTDAEEKNIRQMADSGRVREAFERGMSAIEEKTADAAEASRTLRDSWDGMLVALADTGPVKRAADNLDFLYRSIEHLLRHGRPHPDSLLGQASGAVGQVLDSIRGTGDPGPQGPVVAEAAIPPAPAPPPFTTPSAFRATPPRAGGGGRSAAASRGAADASARAAEALERENALVELRIAGEERYASAQKTSEAAAARVRIEEEARVEAFRKGSDEATILDQKLRESAAKSATATQRAINDNERSVELLELEISLQGQTSSAIDLQLSRLEAKHDLQTRFVGLTEAEAAAYLESAEKLAQVRNRWVEVQAEQRRADDGIMKIATSIEREIGQAIDDSLDGKKIDDWGARIQRWIVAIGRDILMLNFVRPAIGSLFGGNVAQSFGTLGGTGTAAAGGGGLSLSNVSSVASLGRSLFGGSGGSLFGGGGTSNWLNTSIGQPLGFWGGVPNAPGLFGTTTFTNFLGGAGAGFGAGMFLNSLMGGNQLGGTIGSGVGSLAGAAIGSIVPGIGTLLGGFLGGAGGGLFGGPMGNQRPARRSAGRAISFA